jgi:hypothetical protein
MECESDRLYQRRNVAVKIARQQDFRSCRAGLSASHYCQDRQSIDLERRSLLLNFNEYYYKRSLLSYTIYPEYLLQTDI